MAPWNAPKTPKRSIGLGEEEEEEEGEDIHAERESSPEGTGSEKGSEM